MLEKIHKFLGYQVNDMINKMKINTIEQDDIRYIIDNDTNLKQLYNKTILVTGATGLIGSCIIKVLLYSNIFKNSNIRIIGLARNKDKVNKLFSEFLSSSYLEIIYADVINPLKASMEVDYIIHAASPTKSKWFVENPVDTIETIIMGTRNILEFAKNTNIKKMIYLSSMEVYGTYKDGFSLRSEDNLGDIDILNVRSSYSQGKRMAETLCKSYVDQYCLPVTIARLAQTFGPGVDVDDTRLFSQMSKSVINNEDIILHTNGESVINSCYMRDAVKAIILLLAKGELGEVYNVSNHENTATVKEVANILATEIANNKINVICKIDSNDISRGYAPKSSMKLDTHKIRNLGWEAEVDLKESYHRLILSMKEEEHD